jgi:3'-phosphoadenosine 5'-phosphosulfate sulfotransferase (PAPS reductase)/FAD synthetase
MTYWLSYGGGVNSTALAVLLVRGELSQFRPFRFIWSDVQDEKQETYDYVYHHFMPFVRKHGHTLEVIRPQEGVLERSERLACVIQRTVRRCTSEAKIRPINKYLRHFGGADPIQLLGIDAGEAHRARPAYPTDPYQKLYPLVDLNYDREDCVRIITSAGLPVPIKSGCWHCPFMRAKDVLALALNEPCKFDRIVKLEAASNLKHPPADGRPPRSTWGDVPATKWRDRANSNPGGLFDGLRDFEPPCGCYDGHDDDEAA